MLLPGKVLELGYPSVAEPDAMAGICQRAR